MNIVEIEWHRIRRFEENVDIVENALINVGTTTSPIPID